MSHPNSPHSMQHRMVELLEEQVRLSRRSLYSSCVLTAIVALALLGTC